MSKQVQDPVFRQDQLWDAFMRGKLSRDEFFKRSDELEETLPWKEKQVVNATAELCVALHQRDELKKKADAAHDEAAAAKNEADAAQTLVETLKEKLDSLRRPEELPAQTETDINQIKAMLGAECVWLTEKTYPDQCALCLYRKLKLPKFSCRSETVTISMDEETKFIRLVNSPEEWAVFGNSENGKVIGVRKGSMTW